MNYPSYSELLSDYIEESGMTIGEIAKKMQEEMGVKIDRSYISMLKNNKTKNPASEEINRALAEATGGNPDKLIYAAYVERAPEEMKTQLQMIGDINFVLYRLIAYYAHYLSTNNLVDDDDPALKELMELRDNYDTFTLPKKMLVLETLINDAKERNIDPGKLFSDSFPKLDPAESKATRIDALKELVSVLSVEPNKWYAPIKQELKEFTKRNNGPLRFVTTPNNVIYLLTETAYMHEYKDFIDKLMVLLRDASRRYESVGFRYPGFNPNVVMKLDDWLKSGTLTYKGISLTESDKSLISYYVDALLKERLEETTPDSE